jgi:fibronectin-binding autotransporter adhesin
MVALAMVTALSAVPAAAAALTWNTNTSGPPVDGGGTWGSGSNWWNSTTDTAWTSGGTAVFGAGNGAAGPVAISGSQTVNAVIFNAPGSGAYLLNGGGTLGLVGTSPTITMNASSGTIGTVLAGTAGMAESGAGVLTLSASNSYSGTTAINGGTLAISNSAALGTSSVSLSGGGMLNVNFIAATTTLTNPISVGAGQSAFYNLIGSGAAGNNTVTIAGSATLNINGNLLVSRNAGGPGATNFSDLITGSGTLEVGNTNAGIAPLSVSGSQGRCTFTNSGAFTNFAGTIHVDSGANLLFNPSPSNQSTTTQTLTIDSGGYVTILGGTTTAFGALNGSGSIATNAASTIATLSIGNGGGSGVFAGVIAQNLLLGTAPVSLLKKGAGLEVLSGQNSYTAGTTISGGTLQIGAGGTAGSLANSTTSVNTITDNATLAFNRSDSITQGTLFSPLGITGSGNLVQLGPGTLVFNTANSYTGSTTVGGGSLLLSSGSLYSSGLVSVAGGATFGGNGLAGSATVATGGIIQGGLNQAGALQLASLSFSGTGGVQAALGSAASIAVSGGITTTGAGTIVATFLNVPADGTYNLLTYGSGSDPFSAFTLGGPSRKFTLQDSSGSVQVLVSSAVYPVWTGLAGGDWSYAVEPSPKNWALNTTGGTADFLFGDNVLFDDSAGALGGTTNVTLNNGSVSPGLVTFNNNAYSYVLSGTAGIAGSAMLAVTGGGTVTIANSNGYTGGTLLSSGLLNLSNSAALGGGPLAITGGSLDNTSGSAMTLAGNLAQTWTGGFTFVGSSPLNLGTGTVTLLYSPTVNVSGSTLTAGGNFAGGSTGGLNVAGSGVLALSGPLNYPGTTSINNGNLYINGSSGTIGGIVVGNSAGNTGSLYFHSGNLTCNGGSGYGFDTGNVSGGSASYVQDGGILNLGGSYAMNLSNNGSSSFTLSGGALNIATTATFWATIGNNGPMNFTQTGGLFNYSPFVTGSGYDLFIGYGTGAATTLNISGGTFQSASNTILSLGVQSPATMNISGNALVKTGTFNLNYSPLGNASAAATVNLIGGTLQAALIDENYNASDSGGTLNLNGGTLQAASGSVSNWIPASSNFALNVGNGGAFINTNGQNVTIAQGLLQSGGTSSGSLSKFGAGMLTLSGTSSYVGATTISAGTLAVNGALTATSGVSVAAGTTLSGSGSISSSTVNVAAGGTIDLTQNTNASTFSMAGLSFAGSATINLNDVGAQYSTTPAIAVNALTTSPGTVNLNISNIPYGTAGTMQIMSYSSIGGSGTSSFHLASPVGGVGGSAYSLINVGNYLDLSYSSPYLYWSGTGSNTWDTTSTNNWMLSTNGASTAFQTGYNVQFDDRAYTLSGNSAQVVSINAGSLAPASVTFSNTAASYTLSGSSGITGAAALIVNGAGLVTIANSNGYTGPTTLSSGTLQLGTGVAGHDGAIASSNIVNNATLVLSDVGPTSFGGTIRGGGSVYLSGPGAVSLTGSNAFGYLAITNSGSISGGTIALPSGNALVNHAAGVTTISSLINAGANGTGETWASGVGTLNIAGGAKISLASGGLNFAGGNFALGGGVLSVNVGGTLNSYFSLNNAAGTTTNFYQSGGSIAIGTAVASSNIVYLSTAGNTNYMMTGGSLNLNIGSPASEYMDIGNATGTTNVLTINGPTAVVMPEILYLSTAASATGTVNLMSGAIATDGLQNGVASAPGYFNFSGGTLEPMGRIGTQWGSATAASNCTITLSGSNAVISTTAITGVTQSVPFYCTLSGSGALTIAGNGTVTMYGNDSAYSGQLNVNRGTTILANANALGVGSVNVNGGTLNIAAYNTATLNSVTLASGNIAGTFGVVNANAFNLQSGTAGAILGGASTPLTKTTTGQAFLTGANTYGGPTTIAAGTLTLGALGTLGNGPVLTVSPGALLDVSAYGSAGYNLFDYSVGVLTAGRTSSFATDINGTINLAGGTIAVVGPSAAGTLTISGSLNLSGAETYAYVPGDEIALGGAFGQNSNPVALALGGTIAPATYTILTYNGGSPSAANFSMGGIYQNSPTRQSFSFAAGGTATTLTVTGTAANLQWNSSNGTWDIQTTPSWYNTVASAADVFYNADPVTFNDLPGGSAATVNINNTVYPLTLTVSNTAVNYTFTGGGSIAGPAALVKNGPGTLAINTANSFTGGTFLNGGVIDVQYSGALGSGPLTLGGGTLEIAYGFADARNITLTSPAATISVDASQTYSNTVAISGSGALNKAGGGVLVLASSDTYTGGTFVANGMLQLGSSAALGAGGLAANGGTLDLEGYSVTVPSFSGAAGTVTDYGTVGGTTILTVAQSIATNFGGAIVDGPTDLLALSVTSGTLTLSGTNSFSGGTTVDAGTLVLESPTALANGSSLIVGQGASALFAPAAGPAIAAPAGVAAVPEPSPLVLLAFGLGSAVIYRRWRRRTSTVPG